MADADRLSIGGVAQASGHTTVTLRYWEGVGLLEPPPRRSGRRSYPPTVLARVRLIDLAREAGFRLAEIRELLADRQPPVAPGRRWRAAAVHKREELDRQAAAISSMREVLAHLAVCRCDSLEECAARACPS